MQNPWGRQSSAGNQAETEADAGGAQRHQDAKRLLLRAAEGLESAAALLRDLVEAQTVDLAAVLAAIEARGGNVDEIGAWGLGHAMREPGARDESVTWHYDDSQGGRQPQIVRLECSKAAASAYRTSEPHMVTCAACAALLVACALRRADGETETARRARRLLFVEGFNPAGSVEPDARD